MSDAELKKVVEEGRVFKVEPSDYPKTQHRPVELARKIKALREWQARSAQSNLFFL